ncbi:choice-of-anchor L domain-containing protein [Winogradskyella sp. A3E31]|uniref:choice-of-anchor L domain-containing protein n=1 Tax=Winogradskyella sp. A3E31 TaxID=3349637 RepID=UPI00398B2B07
MKWSNHILSVIFCATISLSFAQQISVDNSLSATDLVQNTLVQGCVEVSNISSPVNGNVSGLGSFGYFQRGSSNFPFENGLVLTTGDALAAGNTQNTNVLNDGTSAWGTDADLETTLGINNTLNATTIEFDFISASNQVQFNYILASEEYFANFPCQYSDGFAFLIREAGTSNPFVNIALVPGTSIPVNTNTVHPEITDFCAAENEQYFDGYNLGDTNYNGRTTVLSATAAITPNVTYRIKLVIADQTDQNYDSAVFIEGNSFNSIVELGEDVATCLSQVQLDANINNAQAVYRWYLDGGLLGSETQPTLTATQSGLYTVEIDVPLNGSTCTITDDINILVDDNQTPDPMADYNLCNFSGTGTETFDLSTLDDDVINSLATGNYNFSYHTSLSDAQNNTNAISGNYQNTSNPQTLTIRIEDLDSACIIYNEVDLVVNDFPAINDPATLVVCDDQTADGFTEINLNDVNHEITGGQPNLDVTYHYTQADADTGSNIIPMPYVNNNPNDIVFVSVVNTQTGCISTTTLDIEVLSNPPINQADNQYIDACDSDHDGFANFDLTSLEADILQGTTNVTISYHLTPEDALSGANPIADPTNFANTQNEEQTVYIRVEDNTTGCVSYTPIEVHPNLLLTGTNIIDFAECDEGNDGVEGFDLEAIAETIMFDIPDLTIEFYETEDDRDNGVNELDQSVEYFPPNNPQTIYIVISSPTCSEISDFELSLDAIETFPAIGPQTVCDEDQDNFTTIDLTQFDDTVLNSQSGFDVSYFLSEADADANLNQLPDFYTNTTNPLTVYTRVRSSATFCADIKSFEITVQPAPISNSPNPIVICDDDEDGFFIVNLEDSESEILPIGSTDQVTYYNSVADAEAASNAITNPSVYNAQSELVTARVTNTSTGCYVLETIDITINSLPDFPDITDYRICENDSDNIGDFILSTKDDEILNGQTGKEVLYFETQVEADLGNNPIDKFNAYQNTSNPQTIFVRVQNVSDPLCYGTSTMELVLGTNPQYNEPVDIFRCDDASNDTFETIDLNLVADDITQGITDDLTVTFYTTLENAENGTNPLGSQFTNTVNPQEIYVQISNGTICNSVTSFALTVIPVPVVSTIEPFETCDVDYDGIVNWDLTEAEINISDVRQDNIVVAYYETVEDAEAEVNPITTPENFDNTTNPQTVYIKVTNTLSNCFLTLPIDLNVNLPPAFNDFQYYVICDNDTNYFNLDEINSVIVNDANDVNIVYYPSNQDAIDETNALSMDYTYQTNNDLIHARLTQVSTGCFYIYPFNLRVNPLPIANTPPNMELCDDDFDSVALFNLEDQNPAILGTQNASDYTITYHNSFDDADLGTSALTSPHASSDGAIIYARLENNTTNCHSVTQFETIVHPLPLTDIPQQTICPENFPLVVSAETGFSGDTYLWSTNETSPEIEITAIGTYSVTVTTEFGCSVTSTFDVIESEPADIDVVEVIDFSDPNNITITVTGIGDYLYQLDDFEPQDSPLFENVGLGYHTITIIDVNGCASVTREVLVVDAPKFFTPNNDGAFDTWHITGVETLPGTIVYIFDRYGKLIKQLPHFSQGWDGTYNGNKMPATDYWFTADVQRGGIAFTVKGHFALKR